MTKDELTRIGAGLYVDANKCVYLDMKEFLEAYKLPDTTEVREAVWSEVEGSFAMDIIELIEE